MGPDDERVISKVTPAEWLVGRSLHRHFLKVLHEEDSDERGWWRTHGHTVGLLVELSVEPDKGRGLRISTSKCRLRRRRASTMGTMVKKEKRHRR
jgi:hypothetical protein